MADTSGTYVKPSPPATLPLVELLDISSNIETKKAVYGDTRLQFHWPRDFDATVCLSAQFTIINKEGVLWHFKQDSGHGRRTVRSKGLEVRAAAWRCRPG